MVRRIGEVIAGLAAGAALLSVVPAVAQQQARAGSIALAGYHGLLERTGPARQVASFSR